MPIRIGTLTVNRLTLRLPPNRNGIIYLTQGRPVCYYPGTAGQFLGRTGEGIAASIQELRS
jgi:hypothetical protein